MEDIFKFYTNSFKDSKTNETLAEYEGDDDTTICAIVKMSLKSPYNKIKDFNFPKELLVYSSNEDIPHSIEIIFKKLVSDINNELRRLARENNKQITLEDYEQPKA